MFPVKMSGEAPCAGSAASSSCASLVSLFPLPGSAPMVSSPTRGAWMPESHLRVGHAELGELDQHLRLGVRGGPDIDEHGRTGQGRQHGGQRRAYAARERPQPQPGGGDHPAGRSGRHDRGGLTAPDQLAGDRHAGPGAAPDGQRTVVHAEHVLGRGDGDLVRGGAERRELGGHRLRLPGQDDLDPVIAVSGERPGHDLARSVVAAHRVHRHDVPGAGRIGEGEVGIGCHGTQLHSPRVSSRRGRPVVIILCGI